MVQPTAARQREDPYHNESRVASPMCHATASDFTGCCGQSIRHNTTGPEFEIISSLAVFSPKWNIQFNIVLCTHTELNCKFATKPKANDGRQYSGLRAVCGNDCSLGVPLLLHGDRVQPVSSNPSLKGCSASAGRCRRRSAFLCTSVCLGFQNEREQMKTLERRYLDETQPCVALAAQFSLPLWSEI